MNTIEKEEPPFQQVRESYYRRLVETLPQMDLYLERIPDDAITRFARSDGFELYKKVFRDLGIDDGPASQTCQGDDGKSIMVSTGTLNDLKLLLPRMNNLLKLLSPEDSREFRRSEISRNWQAVLYTFT